MEIFMFYMSVVNLPILNIDRGSCMCNSEATWVPDC